MKEILHKAHEMKAYLLRTRRRLHSLAECGFDLPKTRDFVKNELLSLGYEPRDCGRCGIVAELGAERVNAPAVLLRADMDALPIREETRLPFRAENGHMHACGHDMHTAMLLGAAALLRRTALPVPVRFAFQGAEEILSGAADMMEHGVLSGVGAAFMLHVVPAVPYSAGSVLFPPAGIGAPAAVFFSLRVTGKSAHVGAKETGKDALATAFALYTELSAEASRLGGDFSLTFGKMTAGDAPNVVAGHAVLSGSFRSRDTEKMRVFAECLRQRCHAAGAVALQIHGSCPPLFNHPALCELLHRTLEDTPLPVLTPEAKGGAAEDFAVFAERVPSIALALAAGEAARGYTHPLHHPAVVFDEEALPIGAALYAMAAITLGDALRLQTFTKPTTA